MFGGYDINSFSKEITLSKDYIIGIMIGNSEYWKYVPDNINPKKLTRAFLLTVIIIIIYFLTYSSYWQRFIQGIVCDRKTPIKSAKLNKMEWLRGWYR